MPRREYRTTFRCAEPGCREVQLYVHSTRADEAASWRRQAEHPFKCSRHRKPEQNLRPGNEKTSSVLVATRLNGLDKLFWVPEGAETGSGFAFGPGCFTAYADDFPAGTRLVLTAEVLSPLTTPRPEGRGFPCLRAKGDSTCTSLPHSR